MNFISGTIRDGISQLSAARFQLSALSIDEQRRRRFLLIFLSTLTPILLIYGIVHYHADGFDLNVVTNLLGIAVSITFLVALHYFRNLTVFVYITVGYILMALSYLLAVGGFDGMAYFWFYFYPLIAYFLLGIRRGLVWILLSGLSILLFALFNLGSYHYPLDLALRFAASYMLVCILAHGIESLRSSYYNDLLDEKLALENATKEIQMLSSLLPICSSCKRIRDDNEQWHEIEIYMRQHGGIEFSHGLCSDCRERLYPSLRKSSA